MKNTKLEELIRGLNKDEFRKLGDFLKSPYFNKSRQIIKLYSVLKKHYKTSLPVLNKKIIYKEIFGDAQYNDQKIRSLISDFVKLLDNYLLQIGFGKNTIRQKIILLREFKERMCEKNFEIHLKFLKKYQDTNNFPGVDDYFAYTFYNSYIVMNKSDKMEILLDENNKIPVESVDYYFIYSKLQFQNMAIIGNSPYFPNKKINVWLIEQILKYVENRIAIIKKNHIPIYMEYLIFKIITDYDDEKSARELKLLVQKYYPEIDNIVFSRIFYAFNAQHITARHYSDKPKYTRNFIALIKIFEKKKIFESFENIQETMFYNVIISCLRIGEINFAENFYNKYNSKLDSGSKTGILFLAKSRLEIYRRRFDEAILTLQKVENVNYQVYLNSRVFLAMAYYEKEYFDEIEYLADSVKHFLFRNRETVGLRYYKYYNFFTALIKMIKLNPGDKVNAALLEKKIIDFRVINERQWLIEKLRSTGAKTK